MVDRDVRKNERHSVEWRLEVQGINTRSKETWGVSRLNNGIYASIIFNILYSIVE